MIAVTITEASAEPFAMVWLPAVPAPGDVVAVDDEWWIVTGRRFVARTRGSVETAKAFTSEFRLRGEIVTATTGMVALIVERRQ